MIVAELMAVLGLKVDSGSFDKGTGMISGVKKALGGLLAFEAVKKIGEMVMSTIELGGHLDDLRQKTGLSAESLQEYGYAAKLGGSDMDSFAHGVTKLARTLSEAKGGSEDASKALRQAGLAGADVANALKSGAGLDAALLKIADKFKSMPDGAAKSALAMQLFGKSGVELIPTLNQGGAGLAKLKQEAIDLGVVMGEDTVGAADELGDNIDKLKMSASGLKNQAIAALLPMLKDLVDSTLAWVKANKQLIISTITSAVSGLISVMQVLASVVGVLIDVFQWFGDHMELTQALLIALGIVIGAFAAEAAIAWLIAFWPLALAVAVIAAIILGVKALWKWISEGKGPVASALRWIGGKFADVAETIGDKLGKIRQFFADLAASVRKIWGEMLDWVDAKARSILSNKVVRAAMTLGGNSAAIDIADQMMGATKPREQLHKDYASRDPSDTRSEADFVDQGGTVGPSRSVAGSTNSATSTTINAPLTLTINATGTDPAGVVNTAKTAIKDHLDEVLRTAHAGTGGANQ